MLNNVLKMERVKPVEDSADAVINELSGMTINEHQTHNEGLLEKKIVAIENGDASTEKSGEVSSDDGNEDPAGDDEEQLLESVFDHLTINNNEDGENGCVPAGSVTYTSKGPIVQKRTRANANATTAPYLKGNPSAGCSKGDGPPKAKVEIHKTSKKHQSSGLDNYMNILEEGPCNVGQFVDVASFLPDLAQSSSQPNSSQQQTPTKVCTSDGKPGIPSLPDTSPTIIDGVVVFPRVVVYKKPVIHMVPIPQVAITVHSKLRRMGLQLPQISVNDKSLNKVGRLEDFELFVQLDNVRAIRFRTSVLASKNAVGYCVNIPAQFIELRPFSGPKGNAGIESLLEDVTETEIEEAVSLVNGKDLTDLLKTYGPNEDSMLMHLCCKHEEPPVIRAQVFALVSRILAQSNPTTRANIIQKNASGLSALDYTTVTNNHRLATFLADLYYMMGEDPTCPDISGNTLLHMLARKGDASAPTLQALLALRYSEYKHERGRGPFSSGLLNLKRFMPIHHAVMSRRCPQGVIRTLHSDMPACLTAQTENGSLPIHLACQYSSDPTMIALLLHYNRDVINAKRSDGFTPLHLVASRNDGPADISIGLIPLSEEIQGRMIRLLLDHGADKSICVEEHYIPYDLVKMDRQISRALLKIKGRKDVHESYCSHTETSAENQSSAGKDTMSNGISKGTTKGCNHPPKHLELKNRNPLDKEDNEDTQSNSPMMVANTNSTDSNRELLVSNSLYTNMSSGLGQGHGSPINQNRPPSSTSSMVSTLSPTSSVVIGRNDPFICGGTTPTYMDNFNISLDGSGSPISNGGGSEQQSPQSVVNQPFYSLYNAPLEEVFETNARNSMSHPNSVSSISNSARSYNCYDSLSDSDGERVGTGDSGNESPPLDFPTYGLCIAQEAFFQQPSLAPREENEDCELDIIARALYSHPTIQAVMNHADSGNAGNMNGGINQIMSQNHL